jgi:hypothetical protein
MAPPFRGLSSGLLERATYPDAALWKNILMEGHQKEKFNVKKKKATRRWVPHTVSSIETWSGVCISDLGDQIGYY